MRRRRSFAYGSNLCAAQMAPRCPEALEDGAVELAGWRLIINGRSVATLVPEPGARVFGLIWRLTPACEASLDRHESVAKGVYRKAELEAGGAPALVYLAADTDHGAPREVYLERILRAAEARGLNAAYGLELARKRLEGGIRRQTGLHADQRDGEHNVGPVAGVRRPIADDFLVPTRKQFAPGCFYGALLRSRVQTQHKEAA